MRGLYDATVIRVVDGNTIEGSVSIRPGLTAEVFVRVLMENVRGGAFAGRVVADIKRFRSDRWLSLGDELLAQEYAVEWAVGDSSPPMVPARTAVNSADYGSGAGPERSASAPFSAPYCATTTDV